MTQNNQHTLSGDKPVDDPKDDAFGYAPFAKHLAKSLQVMAPSDGFVVAIYGAWGSGKSSVLNFIEYYLKEDKVDEQPIIVRFNPWWFSGQEHLTNFFFTEVARALSKALGQSFAKTFSLIFTRLIEGGSIPVVSRAAGLVANKIEESSQKDLNELRDELEKILSSQKRRIIIFIDDIDRLTSEEIRQLFGVIKSVAALPQITYLLAFDKDVVVRALTDAQNIPGEAYLEKIVQVPFDLPIPDEFDLQNLFTEKLNIIGGDTPDELFDSTYFYRLYHSGIKHFLRTPRDVIRLTNALKVTYSAVKREVNFVDFIAIESLRIFCPIIYDVIRENHQFFASGGYPIDLHGSTDMVSKIRSIYEAWLEPLPSQDKEYVVNILKLIFSKWIEIMDFKAIGTGYRENTERLLYICNKHTFHTYFRFHSTDKLSNHEMTQLIQLLIKPHSLGISLKDKLRKLGDIEGKIWLTRFLEKLGDYVDDTIPTENIASTLQTLFDIGDLLTFDNTNISNNGIFNLLERNSIILIARLETSKRVGILETIINQSKSLTLVTVIIVEIGRAHGKFSSPREYPNKQVMNKEQLEALENFVLAKIREYAQSSNTLLSEVHLPMILAVWSEWAGIEEVKDWVNKAINSDSRLKEFVEAFPYTGEENNITYDFRSLNKYLNLPEIIDQFKKILEEPQVTTNREFMNHFIDEYEQFIQNGIKF